MCFWCNVRQTFMYRQLERSPWCHIGVKIQVQITWLNCDPSSKILMRATNCVVRMSLYVMCLWLLPLSWKTWITDCVLLSYFTYISRLLNVLPSAFFELEYGPYTWLVTCFNCYLRNVMFVLYRYMMSLVLWNSVWFNVKKVFNIYKKAIANQNTYSVYRDSDSCLFYPIIYMYMLPVLLVYMHYFY